jgi:hypothetical protein
MRVCRIGSLSALRWGDSPARLSSPRIIHVWHVRIDPVVIRTFVIVREAPLGSLPAVSAGGSRQNDLRVIHLFEALSAHGETRVTGAGRRQLPQIGEHSSLSQGKRASDGLFKR